MSSPIPIQNIYYLLLYAWNNLDEGELTDVSKLESAELVDLFASVLNSGIKHLLRRGLDQNYILHQEAIAGVRGRINIGVTTRRMLLQHGRAYCEFDEFSVYNVAGFEVSMVALLDSIIKIVGQGDYVIRAFPESISNIDVGEAQFLDNKIKKWVGNFELTDLELSLSNTINYFDINFFRVISFLSKGSSVFL